MPYKEGTRRRDAQRRYKAKYPDRVVDGHLRRKFGITLEQYDAVLAVQNGACAVCETKDPGRTTRPDKDAEGKRRFFCVDHDHETGRLRGLLCHHCNTGLGHFKDSPALLISAINYLKRGHVSPESKQLFLI